MNNRRNEKEDSIHLIDDERHTRARVLLAAIKAKHATMQFVRMPLQDGKGYREIEKSKYEKFCGKSVTPKI